MHLVLMPLQFVFNAHIHVVPVMLIIHAALVKVAFILILTPAFNVMDLVALALILEQQLIVLHVIPL
jgi:hypothetical protein